MNNNNTSDALVTDDETVARITRVLQAKENLHRPPGSNYIEFVVRDQEGNIKSITGGWNSRVAQGATWQAQLMGSAAGVPANYIALSAATLTITNTDTFMGSNSVGTNELAANGFTRALASYGSYVAQSALAGSASYIMSKTFTATGAQTVVGVALCNSATSQSASVMFEANLSSSTLNTNDTLQVNYTISI